jgi:thiol-disulfide isomerase/thioredoxin
MGRHFFAIFLFAAFMSASCAYASDFSSRFTPTTPPALVPAFPFEDAHSRTLDLKEFRGSYVLLNLWATWCGPCVREMAALDALAQRLPTEPSRPPLAIVALTEDNNGLGAAEGFYKRHSLRHLPVFVDTAGQAPSLLRIRGLPTTLLIDPKGMEIGRIEGDAEWDEADTIAFLEKQMQRNPLQTKEPR